WFTKLYLEVTKAVNASLEPRGFADPEFLARLDVVFAGFFFAALRALPKAPAKVPRAGAPLIEARGRKGIAPIQFALAGMNAHINRDLPLALVAACEHANIAPSEGSPQHHDYLQVNQLLANVEEQIKAQYTTGALHTFDRLLHRFHRLDDTLAMWDIRRARDAAWT